MANSYDIGTGFLSGLDRGLDYGRQNKLREEMRRQRLEDEAARQRLDAEIRAQAVAREDARIAREDARYRDQTDRLNRADALAQRQRDVADPATALAFLRADAQGGPLTSSDSVREEVLLPMAFAQHSQQEAAALRRAELDAAMREDKAAVNEWRRSQAALNHERGATDSADRTAKTAATFVNNVPFLQAVGEVLKRKPELEEIEETRTLDNGTTIKSRRRVPMESPMAPRAESPPTSAAAINYLNLANPDIQQQEALQRKLLEERKLMEAEKKRKINELLARGYRAGP